MKDNTAEISAWASTGDATLLIKKNGKFSEHEYYHVPWDVKELANKYGRKGWIGKVIKLLKPYSNRNKYAFAQKLKEGAGI